MMRYIIYTLLVVFAISCTQISNAKIESAEKLITEDVDSAIVVLSCIREGELSAYDEALSAVVLTRAMLNRGDIITSDSLIKPAYNSLLKRGTTEHKALASYCYAKIKGYSSQIKEATELYLSLFEIVDGHLEGNDYLTRLTAASLAEVGSLYFAQYYYEEAKDYFEQAIVLFEELGDMEVINHLRFMIANSVSLIGDAEKSIEMLEDIQQATTDTELRSWIDLSILQKAVRGEIYSADTLLKKLDSINYDEIVALSHSENSCNWSESPMFMYNTTAAFVLYRVGKTHEAYQKIKLGIEQMSPTSPLNIGNWASAAEIARAAGNAEEALEYQRIYTHYADSLHTIEREQQVRQVEMQYHQKSKDELRLTRTRYQLYLWALGFILLAGATLWAVNSYRRKLRERGRQIEEYLSTIENYKLTAVSFTEKLRESDERERTIKEYLTTRRDMVRQIASTFYTYGESHRFAEKMKELALSEEMLLDIVRVTDLYSGGAVSRLKATFTTWTEKNYNFAALIIAGFSAQEISVMLGMTLGGVYTLKSKLKRKIMDSGEGELVLYFE
ncbi:MAG: hypothetical protein R3Y08_02010 [Rikenellaceae bacterium]